jgi:hypothetical protein
MLSAPSLSLDVSPEEFSLLAESLPALPRKPTMSDIVRRDALRDLAASILDGVKRGEADLFADINPTRALAELAPMIVAPVIDAAGLLRWRCRRAVEIAVAARDAADAFRAD